MDNNNERIFSGLLCEKDISKVKEAVCIQVEKVYDSCKEKNCIENAKVIFCNPDCVQSLVNKAISVKCKSSEIVDVYIDVEKVRFKNGFFGVDVKFFIKVGLELFIPRKNCGVKIIPVEGIVIFAKKVILFGSEGNVKIFKSHFDEQGTGSQSQSTLQQNNLPVAKVEVAEPICLGAKIQDITDKCFEDCCCIDQLPRSVVESLEMHTIEDDDIFDREDSGRCLITRRLVVTIGLFSIIKLIRNVQLLIPAFDFCIPKNVCVAATEENPCELFGTIKFPVNEFFPPQKPDFPRALEEEESIRKKQVLKI